MFRLGVCLLLSISFTSSFTLRQHRDGSPVIRLSSSSPSIAPELPASSSSRFGRQAYWDETYKDEVSFCWYCPWADIEPLWLEMVPDTGARVLVPGVGNDDAAVGLFDAGFHRLCAFDYAPEGVERARELLGDDRLSSGEVDLRIADCRALPFADGEFDAVFEKGTLDAVFLSGGKDKKLAQEQLDLSVQELARTVRRGGVVLSVSTPATRQINEAFNSCRDSVGSRRQGRDGGGDVEQPSSWRQLLDGDVFVTDEGFASINVDATIMAWERT